MKEAGLRLSPSERPGKWEQIEDDPPKVFEKHLSQIELDWELATTETFKRSSELAVVVECSTGIKLGESNRADDIEVRITNNNCRLELLIKIVD